jgi:hypothetical protein
MPNFVQIWWTRSRCHSEMWFVGSNLVDFGPLTPGGHLGFCDKWEILAQACLKGQVVCSCQILSKSNEQEPNAEPKCNLWGQIWSFLDLWPRQPSWILRWEILAPSRNVICVVKYCWFWTFDLWQPSWILPQLINSWANLFLWSRSLFMPNFVQIWWTRSKCRAKIWFLGSNLVDFGHLTSGGHLGFCAN